MKIGIIGDVHLGASYNLGRTHSELHVNSRLIDYTNTLEATISEIVELGAEEIIFTGDIFEHRHPPPKQQEIFSQLLHFAHAKGISRMHIVVGNHDQQRQHLTTTISYLKELNLPHIRVYDELRYETLEFHGKPVANVLFMPYRDRIWLGAESHSDAINMLREQINSKLELMEDDLPRILVGHMAIEGTFFDEGYRDMYSENQLMLPKDMFSGINVTLMGHVHKPEVVSHDPYIAYVGSMEKSGGFESHDKVFAILDLEKAEVVYHREPCREIFDINLDYSNLTMGEDLFSQIQQDIDSFAENHRLESSIVKGEVKISFEDDKYFNARKITSYIRETYKTHICHELRKSVFSPRQSRDERITEDISDISALRMYLENTIDERVLREELQAAGRDY